MAQIFLRCFRQWVKSLVGPATTRSLESLDRDQVLLDLGGRGAEASLEGVTFGGEASLKARE